MTFISAIRRRPRQIAFHLIAARPANRLPYSSQLRGLQRACSGDLISCGPPHPPPVWQHRLKLWSESPSFEPEQTFMTEQSNEVLAANQMAARGCCHSCAGRRLASMATSLATAGGAASPNQSVLPRRCCPLGQLPPFRFRCPMFGSKQGARSGHTEAIRRLAEIGLKAKK